MRKREVMGMPYEMSHEELREGHAGLLVLDVRGGAEILRYPFDAAGAEVCNVPYERFISDEPKAVEAVAASVRGRSIVVVGTGEEPAFVADLLRGEGYETREFEA
jgi:hypothetical protein